MGLHFYALEDANFTLGCILASIMVDHTGPQLDHKLLSLSITDLLIRLLLLSDFFFAFSVAIDECDYHLEGLNALQVFHLIII